jgi:hypothetical protein
MCFTYQNSGVLVHYLTKLVHKHSTVHNLCAPFEIPIEFCVAITYELWILCVQQLNSCVSIGFYSQETQKPSTSSNI